jgi:uncharacterized protein
MKSIRFSWDPAKAKSNIRKHGVSFEEAQTAFYDDNAIEFYDDEHSEWEDRFLLLGISSRMRLLLICHCYRAEDGIIRIVSAREANKEEAIFYNR